VVPIAIFTFLAFFEENHTDFFQNLGQCIRNFRQILLLEAHPDTGR